MALQGRVASAGGAAGAGGAGLSSPSTRRRGWRGRPSPGRAARAAQAARAAPGGSARRPERAVSWCRPSAPSAMPPIKSSATLPASHAGPRPACDDGRAEQPADALQQRSAGGRHRDVMIRRGPRAQRLEIGQRAGVGDRIAAQADREIVAAVLALDADAARQPPHRGVIEEQRLDQRLQQVDEIVVAADVRELVREDRFELLRRQAPPSALAGSSTTGLSQPITVGTSTSVDSSSVTAREMCRRRDEPRRHAAATRRRRRSRRACAAAAPTSSR